MRVVGVPDDSGRLPVDPQVPDPLAHVAARAGPRLPGRVGERVPVAHPLGGRQRRIHRRQRIDQDERRLAGPDVVGHEALLVGLQRRRQRHEQRVDVLADRHLRADLDDVVLLAQLGDDRPLRRELVALEVWFRRRGWPSSSTTPTRFRSVPATTRMLRMISYSAGSPTSKKPITCSSAPDVNATPRNTSSTSDRAVLTLRIRPRLDAEGLARLARRVAERLGVLDQHLDPRAREGVDLLEDADEIRTRLHERLRHVGTDERLDEDRPVRRAARRAAGASRR